MADAEGENDMKVAHFQDVTGVADPVLSFQILEAHNWDLHAAISAMVDNHPSDSIQQGISAASSLPPSTGVPDWDNNDVASLGSSERAGINNSSDAAGANPPAAQALQRVNSSPSQFSPGLLHYPRFNSAHYEGLAGQFQDRYGIRLNQIMRQQPQGAPGLVWRLVTLPFSVLRGSYNLVSGAVGLGWWVAGGVLSYGLGALGFANGGGQERGERRGTARLLPPSTGSSEAQEFIRNFEREYGEIHPVFQTTSFMEALRRAGEEFKFLFLYLHSPEHANTPHFCERTLCSEAVVQFVNENFLAWGGDVRTTEGFQMSNSLKASTFPFCAVVMGSSNNRIVMLQQIEGTRTPDELVGILRRVVEEQGAVLVAARVEEEERRLNRRLREEQDAAYQAALQEDQERERKRQHEADRAAKLAAEEERRRKEEEAAAAQAAAEAAEREASLERRRKEKAASLGVEPDKGPDITQVVVRLPNGERKERRFHHSTAVQSLYDFVDSLGSFDAIKYSLVTNFPRTVYGPAMRHISLKDAALHPHANLFVQVEDK